MQAFSTVMAFIFGSIVGSFLNVWIYRIPRGKSVWRPRRSYCPTCFEQIAWYDNIPLLSYWVLGRMCRKCGVLISPRYFVVELLTASLFAAVTHLSLGRGEGYAVIGVHLALTAVLIVSSFIDIELRIIPDEITVSGIVLAPLVSALLPALHEGAALGRGFLFQNIVRNAHLASLAAGIFGMLAGGLAIYGIGVFGKLAFRREAMGFGDVKLMAMVGGVLGWKLTLLAIPIAAMLGSVIGLLILIRTRDRHIPFGPFLAAASLITLLAGDRILSLLGLLNAGPLWG